MTQDERRTTNQASRVPLDAPTRGAPRALSGLLAQLNAEMAAVVQRVRPGLVEIENGRGGVGAGTIWHPDGLIVTNAHVVGRRTLKVTLATLPARLLAHGADLDLAALAVEPVPHLSYT